MLQKWWLWLQSKVWPEYEFVEERNTKSASIKSLNFATQTGTQKYFTLINRSRNRKNFRCYHFSNKVIWTFQKNKIKKYQESWQRQMDACISKLNRSRCKSMPVLFLFQDVKVKTDIYISQSMKRRLNANNSKLTV